MAENLKRLVKLNCLISDENFELLIHELDSGSNIWKKYYLNGLTFYCDRLNTVQQLKLESALFKYLIFYPKEYFECIKKITSSVNDLLEIHKSRPSSLNMQLFFNAKYEELIKIYLPTSLSTRNEIYNLVSQLDPSRIKAYNKLK